MSISEFDKGKIEAQNCTATDSSVIFTDETVTALQEFGKVLQQIHNRLVSERKIIEVDPHYANRKRDN